MFLSCKKDLLKTDWKGQILLSLGGKCGWEEVNKWKDSKATLSSCCGALLTELLRGNIRPLCPIPVFGEVGNYCFFFVTGVFVVAPKRGSDVKFLIPPLPSFEAPFTRSSTVLRLPTLGRGQF